MDLIVVPFFLAAHVPSNTNPPPMYLESTFNAHVNSELTIVNGSIANHFITNFTSKFICNMMQDNKISCYIRNPQLTVRSTIISTANSNGEILRDTIDIIPFNYINSIPIELVFIPVGIVDYTISDDVHLSKDFLDLFLTITSQMNIGNFYIGMMDGWDMSYIGRCLANYAVSRRFEILNHTMPKYKFNLTSISHFEIEDSKAILIEKQRSIDSCHSLNDYMFGIKYINTSFPVHHRIIESDSRIKISIQQFDSTTDNRYKLYNQDEEIGNATESVYIQLDTIEPMGNQWEINTVTNATFDSII